MANLILRLLFQWHGKKSKKISAIPGTPYLVVINVHQDVKNVEVPNPAWQRIIGLLGIWNIIMLFSQPVLHLCTLFTPPIAFALMWQVHFSPFARRSFRLLLPLSNRMLLLLSQPTVSNILYIYFFLVQFSSQWLRNLDYLFLTLSIPSTLS